MTVLYGCTQLSRQKEIAHGENKLSWSAVVVRSAVFTSCMEELSRHFLSRWFRAIPDTFCSNCGSSVEPNANFCPNCGKGKLFVLKLGIFTSLLDKPSTS